MVPLTSINCEIIDGLNKCCIFGLVDTVLFGGCGTTALPFECRQGDVACDGVWDLEFEVDREGVAFGVVPFDDGLVRGLLCAEALGFGGSADAPFVVGLGPAVDWGGADGFGGKTAVPLAVGTVGLGWGVGFGVVLGLTLCGLIEILSNSVLISRFKSFSGATVTVGGFELKWIALMIHSLSFTITYITHCPSFAGTNGCAPANFLPSGFGVGVGLAVGWSLGGTAAGFGWGDGKGCGGVFGCGSGGYCW